LRRSQEAAAGGATRLDASAVVAELAAPLVARSDARDLRSSAALRGQIVASGALFCADEGRSRTLLTGTLWLESLLSG
jgi:hypothetical protein